MVASTPSRGCVSVKVVYSTMVASPSSHGYVSIKVIYSSFSTVRSTSGMISTGFTPSVHFRLTAASIK